jgi:hypothetical protein
VCALPDPTGHPQGEKRAWRLPNKVLKVKRIWTKMKHELIELQPQQCKQV